MGIASLASILVPAYNEDSVVMSVVDAAPASSYEKLEVIIVDDGSTDGTARLVLDLTQRTRALGSSASYAILARPWRSMLRLPLRMESTASN